MTTFYNKTQTEEPKYMHHKVYLASNHFEGEYLAS